MADNFFKNRNGIALGNLASNPSNPRNGDIYYNTTLNKFQKYENGVWGALGGGGSGSGKNYLSAYTASTSSGVPNTGNGDLEFGSTSGFSLGHVTLTSNFPSGVPTFGSGASGNLSLSAISSSQLAGLYSLGYVSSAATTAGDFVATDAFFVDKEDQAKMMTFSFAYNAFANASNGNFSGTSSNSFAVAIYDVTNSAWIQPAGVFNLVQNAGVGICTGTFQTTSNSTQYRLVVYNANATSGAITMYFDDFIVGPQTVQKGPAMSDWALDTRPFTFNNFGTTGTPVVYSRRVGDTQEFRGYVTIGTPVASTASLSLPFTIDSSKFGVGANQQDVGIFYDTASSASNILTSSGQGVLFYDGSATTSLFFTIQTGSGAFIKDTGAQVSNTSQTIMFRFSVPVLGWSSNSVMSNDTDTRAVVFVGNSTSGSSGSAETTVTNWVAAVDTHAALASGTSYTIPVAGYYEIYSQLQMNSATSVVNTINVYQNGVKKAANSTYQNNNIFPCPQVTTILKCVAGDLITIKGSNSDNVGLTANAVSNIFVVKRVSGPAVVAASEKVYLLYTGNAGTALTANVTNVDFATKVVDSHGAWSGTVFTAPRSGWYDITGGTFFTTVNGTGVYLYINGVKKVELTEASSGTLKHLAGGYYLNGGDTLSVRSASSLTLSNDASEHWISIRSQG